MSKKLLFLKTLGHKIEHIVKNNDMYDSFNLYFQDESRFGLKTHTGRCITVKGVKPIAPYQHKFQTTYLWGSYSPINGDAFVYEINGVSLNIFSAYLDALSNHKPKEYKILVMDNAGFHNTKNIDIPSNIGLINIPAYSPELNPCERMWHYIKSKFKNQLMLNMEELKKWLHKQVNSISKEQVMSIVHDQLYVNAFNAQFIT